MPVVTMEDIIEELVGNIFDEYACGEGRGVGADVSEPDEDEV